VYKLVDRTSSCARPGTDKGPRGIYGKVTTQPALHVGNLRTNVPQRRQTHEVGVPSVWGKRLVGGLPGRPIMLEPKVLGYRILWAPSTWRTGEARRGLFF
jgi:hypothetical protein